MFTNVLDAIRIGLYVAVALIGLMLFQAWQAEHAPTTVVAKETLANNTASNERFVPNATTQETAVAPAATQPSVATPAPVTGKLVEVKTDVLNLKIDTIGGDIVQASLLDYPESLGSIQPFLLLNDNKATEYIAESGLLGTLGPDTSNQKASYQTEKTSYTLEPNQNELIVKLNWQKNGVNIAKTYTFTRSSYEVRVGYDIQNDSTAPWSGRLYTQLIRTNTPPVSTGGFVNLATYFGAAVSTQDKPFEKIDFKKMTQVNFNQQIENGWAAMIQHYFITAWVPPKGSVSDYYTHVSSDGLYTIGMIAQPLNAKSGEHVQAESKLYVGPSIASNLEQTAPNLKLTIDYGWFWFISAIIFWMMQHIYNVIGNWGWSIILVTIVIKILFYKLSAKSYASMSALKRLQPRIEALKERFGDDKQAMTKATLELYKQEKVNPMSGCLPILIQIPVFIALYWVLVESVQLRQAPFMLWIHDLSVHDPYYILPLLMGISMFVQQKLNPPPPDPMQAKVMMFMPVIFTVMFASFPAGLMLYWIVNNSLSVLQQWYIMNHAKR